MRSSFPKIIFSPHELALVNTQDDLDSFVYSLSDKQKQRLFMLLPTGHYVNLSDDNVAALNESELALRVTKQLAQEGVCCLSKITKLTPSQAFAMLAD